MQTNKDVTKESGNSGFGLVSANSLNIDQYGNTNYNCETPRSWDYIS